MNDEWISLLFTGLGNCTGLLNQFFFLLFYGFLFGLLFEFLCCGFLWLLMFSCDFSCGLSCFLCGFCDFLFAFWCLFCSLCRDLFFLWAFFCQILFIIIIDLNFELFSFLVLNFDLNFAIRQNKVNCRVIFRRQDISRNHGKPLNNIKNTCIPFSNYQLVLPLLRS